MPHAVGTTITTQVPAGPWLKGAAVTVGVAVKPVRPSRVAGLQLLSGGQWRTVAHAMTSSRGTAQLHWTPSKAGRIKVRVHLAKAGSVAAATTAAVQRTVVNQLVRIKAPGTATVSGPFELTVTVHAPATGKSARLTVLAPSAGSQIAPPNDFAIDPSTHKATVTVPSGAKRTYLLAWRAPGSATTLRFRTELAATGIDEKDHADVAVTQPPAGSFSFDSALHTGGQTRATPHDTNPNMYWNFCGQVPAVAVPSYSATLSAIATFVHAGTGTTAWKNLHLGSHPERADDVAAISFGADEPTAALAAALVGVKHLPTDIGLANDLAAAANMVRHPEWAIAIEQHAAALNGSASTGIAGDAVRLTNLAHAHALRKELAAALDEIRQADAMAPGNPQIEQERSAIEGCKSLAAAAQQDFDKSLRPDGQGDDFRMNNAGRINAGKLWDLRLGSSANLVLPTLPVDQSVLLEHNQHAYYSTTAGDGYYANEAARLQTLEDSLRTDAWNGRNTYLNQSGLQPVTKQQFEDIYGRMGPAANAQLAKMADGLWNDWDAVSQFHLNCSPITIISCEGQNTDTGTCADQDAAFATWSNLMTTWENDLKAYVETAWPVWTGLVANITDPNAQTALMDSARSDVTSWLQDIAAEISDTSNFEPDHDNHNNSCRGPGSDPEPAQADAQGTTPAPCAADSLASRISLNASATLSDNPDAPVGLSVKTTCAATSLTVTLSALPFLKGFVKIRDAGDGSGITIYAGSRAQAGGAQFDSAFYLTFNAGGHLADLGVDVGPEYNAGSGIVRFTAYSDHLHMSAMSLFTNTPPTF